MATNHTRTFTDDEQSVVTRALIAIRPHLDDDDRELADGIIRDGWISVPVAQ